MNKPTIEEILAPKPQARLNVRFGYGEIVVHFFYTMLLLVFSLAASASGSNNVSPEQGVWTGTIGDGKVMACFMRDDDPAHTNQSAYFYLRYSKPISLIPDPNNKNSWFEGDIKNSTGVWSISVLHDRITGNWSNPTKTKSLPIQLTRFKSISSNHSSISSCSPELGVFNPAVYPQVLSQKIAYSGEKNLNGRRYRVSSALEGAVKSVELIGESETIGLLNVLLANELRAGMLGYYGCPTIGERDSRKIGQTEKPDYQFSIEPLFWNEQWISFVTRSSGYCGGAHPFSDYSYSTWNLTTGKELNPWEWIKNSKVSESLNRIITKKAIKQRLALYRKVASEESGCLDAIQVNSQYQIRLGKTGFVFTQVFPHVAQACTDDIEITYGELMPFLTKKGKAVVEAIQEKSSQDAAR